MCIILTTGGTKEEGTMMFILVSYNNNALAQDLLYHGRFDNENDVRKELEEWAYNQLEKSIEIDESAFVYGVETEYEDGFHFEMYNNKVDGYIYGSMYYISDYDYLRIEFCIVEV